MLTMDTDHVYRLGKRVIPSVTQILTASGAIDTSWYTPEAAERGRRIHEAIAVYVDDPQLADMAGAEATPYLNAYRLFMQVSKARVIDAEQRVYCKSLGYAGTYDQYLCIDGYYAVLDIKTGAVQPWCAMQTAAYAWAIKESGRNVHKRFGLHLDRNGSYQLHAYGSMRDDMARFVTHLLAARKRGLVA